MQVILKCLYSRGTSYAHMFEIVWNIKIGAISVLSSKQLPTRLGLQSNVLICTLLTNLSGHFTLRDCWGEFHLRNTAIT